MIQPTSLDAYESIKPDLGDMQQQVYMVIKHHPNCSNHDISRILGWEINRVTPRVKELRDKNIVISWSMKIDRLTKRKVMTWKVVE